MQIMIYYPFEFLFTKFRLPNNCRFTCLPRCHTNEKELLLQVANGDEQAFSALFYNYKAKLFSFILDITSSREAAEDVVQDVFLKIWQQKDKLKEVDNFNAYIFKISQNHSIDQLRKFSREAANYPELPEDKLLHSDNPEDILLYKEIEQQLQKAVAQLPSSSRKYLSCTVRKALRHEEIAKELNLSVSTVQNHMFRALANIRKYIGATHPKTGLHIAIIVGLRAMI